MTPWLPLPQVLGFMTSKFSPLSSSSLLPFLTLSLLSAQHHCFRPNQTGDSHDLVTTSLPRLDLSLSYPPSSSHSFCDFLKATLSTSTPPSSSPPSSLLQENSNRLFEPVHFIPFAFIELEKAFLSLILVILASSSSRLEAEDPRWRKQRVAKVRKIALSFCGIACLSR